MKKFLSALRRGVFWLHLIVGIAIGLVVLVMGGTGTLLSFERQITEAADGYHITPPPGAVKLGAEELMDALQKAAPETAPTALTVRSEADAPASFQFGREKTLFVDPYTGKILGEGGKKTRAFFQFVTGLHRWLAMTGSAKDVGQKITSAAAVGFFFMVLSGLWLWFPRRWSLKGLRAITWFQGRLKGRARDWNWHHVLGLWFAIPLLMTSATGVIMAYPWANGLLFASVGETPPPREEGRGGPRREGGGGGPGGEGRRDGGGEVRKGGGGGRGGDQPARWPETTEGFNDAFAMAEAEAPGWITAQLQIPRRNDANFTLMGGPRGRPDLSRSVTVDLDSGEVTKVEKFEDQSQGRQLRKWVRWIHTGEAGGWFGQTISFFGTLAALGLIWTGFALSWRRFFKKKPKKVEAPITEAATASVVEAS